MENSRLILSILSQIMLILLPVNHVIYAQQPMENVVVMHTILVKIGDRNFPVNYRIDESKVFGNYSKVPINNNISMTKTLLGNITHMQVLPSNSTLVITTNSSISIALTIAIPTNLSAALTNNVSSEALNQPSAALSVNGHQIFALICPRGDVTKVFIPSLSSTPQIITVNLNPKTFKASSTQTCNDVIK